MRPIYGVFRVFPGTAVFAGTIFHEAMGTKKKCLAFAQKAAKPRLVVCKLQPIVEWDAKGKLKKNKKRERGKDGT